MALINMTTKAGLAAGWTRTKWVLAIEAYPRIVTDADTTKALEAWAGTDAALALDGLVVEYRAEQNGDPHDPFQGGGGAVFHVKPDEADTFGVDVNRRASGAFTTIGGSLDRDDLAVSLRSNANFAAGPAEAYIGTECVGYSSHTSSTMTLTDRGKYSWEGVKSAGFSSGSGSGTRFTSHHRVSRDQQQVQNNPIISQLPRRWIGRRVYLYLHLFDSDGNLNSKANAQLVFAGRIKGIADDPNNFHTSLECSHILDELAGAVIFRDQWGATTMNGIYIPTGATFKMTEMQTTTVSSNALTVVASGASGANQVNAGYYSLEEICSFINNWLGSEKGAARINGAYSFASPVLMGDGVYSKVDWYYSSGTISPVSWWLDAPSGVIGFLGFSSTEAVATNAHSRFGDTVGTPNQTKTYKSKFTPWRTAVFAKGGPGGSLPSFKITTENERGQFVDFYDLMPSLIKPSMDSTKQWGLFLVDDRILIQASYSNGVLSDCFITPFGQTSAGDSNSPQPFYTLGRRADDDSGPVTIRQVVDVEASFKEAMNILFYNTGTPGYNHGTYDTRAYGFGVGFPGALLGDPFERSIANLPNADVVMRIRLDEPTTLAELIGAELLARRAFPVWKDGGIVFQKWHTPVISLASFTLSDDNKAAPAGNQVNHRTPTLESNAFARPVVKMDYNPDFVYGRSVRFRASIQLEDQVAVDDGGGEVGKPLTIKLRNTPGVDPPDVIPGYLATMPMTSRPSKFVTRSIDITAAEGIAPGDIMLLDDTFARDPITGQRQIGARACSVTRHAWDYGGPVPGRPQEKARQMGGEVELNFFDVQRGSQYGPSADVDFSRNTGGFSAGYNNGTLELQTFDHHYTETTDPIDASYFANSYAVVIVERDPVDPAAPVFWERTLAASGAVNGNKLKLSAALSAPAWDPTKKYRVIFNKYSVSTAIQKDNAFQADDADERVEDVDEPYHYCSTPEPGDWTRNVTADPAEFIANLSFGDGKSHDVGHEAALLRSINALYDYKTAHQYSILWTEVNSNPGTNTWESRYLGLLYFGQEELSLAVYRYVTLAPFLAFDNSNTGGATFGDVRITICRDLPPGTFGATWSTVMTPTFAENYSQNSWTTSSTTYATGTPATFAVNVKDLTWGLAFVIIECRNAFCRGLAKGIEGPRTSRINFGPFDLSP